MSDKTPDVPDSYKPLRDLPPSGAPGEMTRERKLLVEVAETQMALAVHDADLGRMDERTPEWESEREDLEEEAERAIGSVLAWWDKQREAAKLAASPAGGAPSEEPWPLTQRLARLSLELGLNGTQHAKVREFVAEAVAASRAAPGAGDGRGEPPKVGALPEIEGCGNGVGVCRYRGADDCRFPHCRPPAAASPAPLGRARSPERAP